MGGTQVGSTSTNGDEKRCIGVMKDSSKKKTDTIVLVVIAMLVFALWIFYEFFGGKKAQQNVQTRVGNFGALR